MRAGKDIDAYRVYLGQAAEKEPAATPEPVIMQEKRYLRM